MSSRLSRAADTIMTDSPAAPHKKRKAAFDSHAFHSSYYFAVRALAQLRHSNHPPFHGGEFSRAIVLRWPRPSCLGRRTFCCLFFWWGGGVDLAHIHKAICFELWDTEKWGCGLRSHLDLIGDERKLSIPRETQGPQCLRVVGERGHRVTCIAVTYRWYVMLCCATSESLNVNW